MLFFIFNLEFNMNTLKFILKLENNNENPKNSLNTNKIIFLLKGMLKNILIFTIKINFMKKL